MISIYPSMILLCHDMKRPDEAFGYAERARSRAFLDVLALSVWVPGARGESTAFTEEQNLALKLRLLQGLLRMSEHEAQQRMIRSEIQATHEQYNLILDALEETDPEYVSLRRGTPLSFEELQTMSPNRIVLVEYFTTDDVTLLFGVRADWDKPEVVEIKRPLSDIRDYVTNHFGPETAGNQPVRQLDLDEWQQEFGEFIDPIKDWADPGDYLYLVPHDALHYLPLHALKLEGQYLIERNPVLYTPSASVLKYCQAKRKGRRDQALVLGDSYGDLVHARAEALAVAQAFGTQAYLGQAAQKSLVQNRLKENKEAIDVLHFACHGRFHHTQPLKSGILMAPEENGEESSEYEPKLGDLPVSRYLTAEDFFGMEMQVDLVMLSACESGVSDIRPGDELFGLMRALIYAGTPSVVMSLWSVDQISSGIFMQTFYKVLKQPKTTKVEALQTAQLTLKEMTAREAIDYCQATIDLLQNAGEDEAIHALTEDMADLHFQAGNYPEAVKIYEALLDKLDPEAGMDKYQALDVALARCEMLTGQPVKPDYNNQIYSHPFHWAPFILVGDWQ